MPPWQPMTDYSPCYGVSICRHLDFIHKQPTVLKLHAVKLQFHSVAPIWRAFMFAYLSSLIVWIILVCCWICLGFRCLRTSLKTFWEVGTLQKKIKRLLDEKIVVFIPRNFGLPILSCNFIRFVSVIQELNLILMDMDSSLYSYQKGYTEKIKNDDWSCILRCLKYY